MGALCSLSEISMLLVRLLLWHRHNGETGRGNASIGNRRLPGSRNGLGNLGRSAQCKVCHVTWRVFYLDYDSTQPPRAIFQN